jgi:predicted RNase H-like HicB family nuclease
VQTRYYPAVIETDARGGFGVFFPDFPGCVTAGDTIDEAMANAEEALAGHIEVSVEHGEAIPPPSDLQSIKVDADVEAVARVLVRADLPGDSKPLSITLPEGLIARIDRKANLLGYSRSAFLAEGARRMLAMDAPQKPKRTAAAARQAKGRQKMAGRHPRRA